MILNIIFLVLTIIFVAAVGWGLNQYFEGLKDREKLINEMNKVVGYRNPSNSTINTTYTTTTMSPPPSNPHTFASGSPVSIDDEKDENILNKDQRKVILKQFLPILQQCDHQITIVMSNNIWMVGEMIEELEKILVEGEYDKVQQELLNDLRLLKKSEIYPFGDR